MHAYTPVQARQSLTRPPPSNHTYQAQANVVKPMIPSTSTPNKKPRVWPEPVRLYVQRCFVPEHMIDGISKQEMEMKLKAIITNAAETDNLETVDWASLPLPQEMIREERNKSSLLSSPHQRALISPWTDGVAASDSYHPVSQFRADPSKKRKSAEINVETEQSDATVPWRTTNSRNLFEDRITYAANDKRQRTDQNGKNASKSKNHLESRRKRFENDVSGLSSPHPTISSRDDSPFRDVDYGPVVGRCQKLEKNYFRLTSAPNPDTVRPLPILKETFQLLKKKWRIERNYIYICDQFKSLRQDLTVQHIKNEFTVEVYENHARIALEKGDIGEYNQCQTQLRALYRQKLGGHPEEFKAYRILYFIHTCNRSDMNDALADLTPADKTNPHIKHALDVRSALALGNYHWFFQLYLDNDHNMSNYLMDMFVARERIAALAGMCKAYVSSCIAPVDANGRSYKPEVKIRLVTEELAFESDAECAQFILDHAFADLLQERDDEVMFLTGKAGQAFEIAKQGAFKVIDIKGQI